MKSFTLTTATWRRLRVALPGALIILAAACASTPPIPTSNLQAAQQAIANAERVEAGTHAALELSQARNKLASAQQAVNREEMMAAAQLADEARAEAELAAAKAGATKAKVINEEMKKSNATLAEEMQRKTGDIQ